MLQHLPLIWKNSVRNKRRSLLTIASIAASLCLLGLMMAFYNGLFLAESSADQAYRLIARNKVSIVNPLPRSYQPKMEQVEGVGSVMIMQWFGGVYKDARDPANFFARMAIEPAKFRAIYPEYRIDDAQWQTFVADRQGAVVGRKLATRHNFEIGTRIPVKGDIFPVSLEFIVRAIYDADRDNENLWFHYDYLNESMRSTSRGALDQVSSYAIRMAKPEDAPRISRDIDAMFRNSTAQTKTETERAFELSFLAFLGNVKMFLAAISGAITFTILLVAGNTMAMAVRERIREVGVLKTLGFTQGKILTLLLGESMVIALLGGLIGLGLATAACEAMRNAPSSFMDMSRIHIGPGSFASGIAVALVIGGVSSIWPAWSASRMPILDALRTTD